MLAGNWFGKRRSSFEGRRPHQPLQKGRRRKESARGRSLRVEELEDRRMLALYIVNNLFDLDGDGNVVTGSLRNALALANASADESDTIVFADFLFTDPDSRQTFPGAIVLDGRPNGRQLTITDDVQILGPGPNTLSIIAGGDFRIFETNIDSDEEIRPVTIGGVTLSGGNLNGTADSDANRGGAIFNREGLTLIETIVSNNSATWGGGAIYSPIGAINVTRSLFQQNSSGGGGGAILLGDGADDVRPNLTVSNSTFTQNSTFGQLERPGYGGGVYNFSGDVTVEHSTFVGNNASDGGGGVATYGLSDVEGEVRPIVTALTHSILFGNTGLPTLDDPADNSDDIFPVRTDLEGAPLAPTLNLDLNGGYNFIGHIGGGALRGDPNNSSDPSNPLDDRRFHFYEVITTAEGESIDWLTADLFGDFGPGNTSHLASIAANAPGPGQTYSPQAEFTSENDFIFSLIDDDQYWREFVPSEPDPPPPPQNIGPWIGGIQVDTSMTAVDGWEWVTTNAAALPNPIDPFDFDAWATGQPDDGALITAPTMPPTPVPVQEDRIAFFEPASPVRAATWGDLPAETDDEQAPIAYILEYDQGNNFFGVNPQLLSLGDYGGATPTFYPDSFSGSPLIDAGAPGVGGDFEQRGKHFSRVFGSAIDIGAVEVQNGQFIVDALLDETDGQYSFIFEDDDFFFQVDPTYTVSADFSLREAVEFSEKNPEFDFITFSTSLLNLDDPTSSPAPTILLKLRSQFDINSAISVTVPVSIIGPTGFELEIDATGNDLTPTVNNSDGTRIFSINDFDDGFMSQISISGLTLLGGDVVGTGGAVINREDLTLSEVRIKENYASSGGGGVSTSEGELTILGSALFDNEAGFEGGALLVDQSISGNISKANVSNSTLSRNAAARGAAILNNDSEVLVEFSTITQNTAPIGAGIANLNRPNTFTQLNSTIVSDNNGDDIRILQGAVPNVQSLGFNIVGTGNALGVFIQPGDQPGVVDPMLSDLVLDGGFSPVHRLLLGSPAIDTGDSTAVAGVGGVPMYDQRGEPFTRVFDGVQDTKDRIDVGAYELQGTVFVVDTPLDENDGNISTGNLSLREAVELSNANPLLDTITFNPTLAGSTIFQQAKNSGALLPGTPTDIRITDSVNIVGLGEALLTLDGSNALTDINVIPLPGEVTQRSRFFTIDDGDNANDLIVNVSGLTFTNSSNVTDMGASIMSHEQLTLEDVKFINNSTLGDGFNGGAVFQRYGSLTLDDVTLTANTTDGVDADGGAVYVRDADLTIERSTISGNATTQTLGSGGGIHIRGGTLNMTYGYVSSNLAPGGEADGAGIFGYQSVLNISNSYITGNLMTGSNSEGAGLFAKDSILTLTNSYIALNRTTGTQSEGAGMYFNGGTATIEQSTISQNETSGLAATGGGIAVVGGELVIRGSTLDRNATSGNDAPGGGIHNSGGEVTLIDSTISGGSASGVGSRGGAIFSSTTLGGSEKTLLVNATVSGNSAAEVGGGVYNAGGLTEIRHSTITNNSVPFFGNGGGVASLGNAATTLTRVYSSIIAGNFASNDPVNPLTDVDSPAGVGQNTFQSLGYNVIGKGLPLALNAFNQIGDQNSVEDPMVGPLAFNGGFTRTHDLLEDSPAVNAGDPSAIPGVGDVPVNDQRGTGFPRLLAGRMDAGAVESPFSIELAADFDSDGDVDGADFLAWQRGLGTPAATKSDGDANSDTNVDSIDLGMWASSFGDTLAPLVVSSVAAVSAENSEPVHSASEPLVASAVLIASPRLTGLTLDSLTIGGGPVVEVVHVEETAEADSVAKDESFAAFSQQAASSGYDDLRDARAANEVQDEQLDVTIEDHIFELLGTGAS